MVGGNLSRGSKGGLASFTPIWVRLEGPNQKPLFKLEDATLVELHSLRWTLVVEGLSLETTSLFWPGLPGLESYVCCPPPLGPIQRPLACLCGGLSERTSQYLMLDNLPMGPCPEGGVGDLSVETYAGLVQHFQRAWDHDIQCWVAVKEFNLYYHNMEILLIICFLGYGISK